MINFFVSSACFEKMLMLCSITDIPDQPTKKADRKTVLVFNGRYDKLFIPLVNSKNPEIKVFIYVLKFIYDRMFSIELEITEKKITKMQIFNIGMTDDVIADVNELTVKLGIENVCLILLIFVFLGSIKAMIKADIT